MSGNEHIKIKKIILNQFAKDTQLNSFKISFEIRDCLSNQRQSLKYLKGNFKERELNCRQFGSNR